MGKYSLTCMNVRWGRDKHRRLMPVLGAFLGWDVSPLTAILFMLQQVDRPMLDALLSVSQMLADGSGSFRRLVHLPGFVHEL